ncbi:MAG: hypothetical protein KatS3mg054_1123 [Chloroflexus sp.]|nr:MAG: hypothetical protein KatS3mg054_1123 [Chloroflexus sp.]
MSNSDLVDLVKEAKSHTHSFTLWPDQWRRCNLQNSSGSACPYSVTNWTDQWRRYNLKNPLSWNTYAFSQASTGRIPDQPGIYAFLIQPNIANNLNASYLIYIGKTERTLRVRFQEYLREVKNRSGRPKICLLLGLYDGYLSFSCAVVKSNTLPATLNALEKELLKAFIPPANDRIPVEVGRVIQAF